MARRPQRYRRSHTVRTGRTPQGARPHSTQFSSARAASSLTARQPRRTQPDVAGDGGPPSVPTVTSIGETPAPPQATRRSPGPGSCSARSYPSPPTSCTSGSPPTTRLDTRHPTPNRLHSLAHRTHARRRSPLPNRLAHRPRLGLARYGGAGIVALGSAVISYGHLSACCLPGSTDRSWPPSARWCWMGSWSCAVRPDSQQPRQLRRYRQSSPMTAPDTNRMLRRGGQPRNTVRQSTSARPQLAYLVATNGHTCPAAGRGWAMSCGAGQGGWDAA
jgi:hypothetical protein